MAIETPWAFNGAVIQRSDGLSPTTGIDSVAGVTPGGLQISSGTEISPVGKSYNYTVVIQLPVPFINLNLNLNLLGDFILPALSALGVPQATLFLIANANVIFQNIINDVQALIRAIPEATVTVLVKVGPAIVFNVMLMAKKVPVKVELPTFQLGLPNFAVDLNFNITIPFPAPPPVIIQIPIPYPIVTAPGPLLNLTGGQVSATAGAGITPSASTLGFTGNTTAGLTPITTSSTPFAVSSPISLPQI